MVGYLERFHSLAQKGVQGTFRTAQPPFSSGRNSPQSNNRKGNCRLFKATTAYSSACNDARAALAQLLNGGTRVRHWQSVRILRPDTRRLQLPLDDCCRLVLLYLTYSMQQTEQSPNDPPQMRAKSTTTSNHPSTTPYK